MLCTDSTKYISKLDAFFQAPVHQMSMRQIARNHVGAWAEGSRAISGDAPFVDKCMPDGRHCEGDEWAQARLGTYCPDQERAMSDTCDVQVN